MHYFFTNLLLYSKAHIRQTKYILMMTKEKFTKIVNFIPPVRGSCASVWQYQSVMKMHYLSTLLINSTLIVLVLRDYNAAFLCQYWFLLILKWDCWYANTIPLTRGPWRVSDTLGSVKPGVGLLLFKFSVVCNNVWLRECTICIHQILFR